jgi:putative redox protein
MSLSRNRQQSRSRYGNARQELAALLPGRLERETHLKAIVNSAGGVASSVQVGSHTLLFDQPGAVPGGEDRGPSPLDVLAATVGACAHYFAAAFLLARKLSPEGLRVEVEAEKVREPSPRFGKLSLHVLLPAGVPEHYLPQIERAVRNCPAYGTLVHPPDVELSIAKATTDAGAPAA